VAPAPLGYGHGPCECDEHEALLSQRGRAMLLSVVSFNSTIRPAQSSVTVFFPCGGLSWLPVSFLLHVKYTLSYRIVSLLRLQIYRSRTMNLFSSLRCIH